MVLLQEPTSQPSSLAAVSLAGPVTPLQRWIRVSPSSVVSFGCGCRAGAPEIIGKEVPKEFHLLAGRDTEIPFEPELVDTLGDILVSITKPAEMRAHRSLCYAPCKLLILPVDYYQPRHRMMGREGDARENPGRTIGGV